LSWQKIVLNDYCWTERFEQTKLTLYRRRALYLSLLSPREGGGRGGGRGGGEKGQGLGILTFSENKNSHP